MSFIQREHVHFVQTSDKPGTVSVPAGGSVTVFNNGATLYYGATSAVTSSSNDGSISSGSSATFTSPKFVITAQGASTSVFAQNAEVATDNLRVGGNLTVAGTTTSTGAQTFTGAATLTGGVAGGKPWNIHTWQPVAATSGTDTACSNGTAYVGSVLVPANCTVTGIQYLVGSVGGTDKVVASLHNASGTPVANSATAGATVGTAAEVQQVAFTSTYAAVGPAFYFVALTFNGTTAKFRSVPAHTQNGVIGNGVTQTFGTVAAFTAPSTFTADKVPVASLY